MRGLGLPERLRLLRYPEGLYAHMKVALLGAIVLASPLLAYQAWAFVRTALRRRERRLVLRYAAASVALFLAGAAFGFFVLIPIGLRFLIVLAGDAAEPMIGLSDYLSLVVSLALAAGIVFEVPLVLRFAVRAGVFSADALRRGRGPAVLAAFILAAVLTPPDPFTQVLLAVPMVGLYEIGIVASDPRRRDLVRLAALAGAAGIGAGVYLASEARADARAAVVAGTGAWCPVAAEWEPREALTLELRGGGRILLRPGSRCRLAARRLLVIERGELFAETGAGHGPVRIQAPDATMVLRNAAADVRVGGAFTEVTGVRGEVGVVFEDRELRVTAGRRRRFAAGGQPVNVEDVTSWRKAPALQEDLP